MLRVINGLIQTSKSLINEEELIFKDIAYMIAFISNQLSPYFFNFKGYLAKNHPNIEVEKNKPKEAIKLWSCPCLLDKTKKMIELSNLIYQEIIYLIRNTDFPIDEFILCHEIMNEKLKKRDNIFVDHYYFPPFAHYSLQEAPEEPSAPHFISKFSKCFDFPEFVPTNESVQYLLDHIESLSKPQMIAIHSELVESEKDLAQELLLARQISSNNENYFNYPPLDIIRENPQYKSYVDASKYNLHYLRTELNNFARSLNQIYEIFSRLESTFESAFAIPHLELDEMQKLIKQDIDLFVTQRKLLTFNEIVDKVHMLSFTEWESQKFVREETELLKKLLEMEKNDPNDVIKALDESLSRYEVAEKKITEETSKVEESRKQKEEKRQKSIQIQGKGPKPALRKSLDEIRKRVRAKDEEYQKKKKNFYGKISNAFEEHKKALKLANKPEITSSFERILAEMSDDAAQCEILKEKIKKKKAQIQKSRKRTEECKKKTQQIRSELESIQKELAGIQEKSKEEEPEAVQIQEELATLKDKYFCGACQTRPRDSFFMGCGHTYCMDCIKNSMIKKRSRKCPTCRHVFSPTSDVKPLNFSKGSKM